MDFKHKVLSISKSKERAVVKLSPVDIPHECSSIKLEFDSNTEQYDELCAMEPGEHWNVSIRKARK